MQTVSVQDLYDRAVAWNEKLVDTEVESARALDFFSPRQLSVPQQTFGSATGVVKLMSASILNDHAWSQLCGRLDIPAEWAGADEHCAPDLREIILGHKFDNADPEKKLLVRTRENGDGLPTCRAVLSGEYTRFDNLELVSLVREAIQAEGIQAVVLRPDVGDELRAYVVLDSIDFGARHAHEWHGPANGNGTGGGPGGMFPAIYIRNSEIGTGKVRVLGGLVRSWCSNGAVLGWKEEDSFALTHRFSNRHLLAQRVVDAILVCLRMSEGAAERMIELTNLVYPPERIGTLVNEWAGKYGLLVESKDAWKAALDSAAASKGQITGFDAVDWATFVAQGLQGERREQMEVMAGNMIFDLNAALHYPGREEA